MKLRRAALEDAEGIARCMCGPGRKLSGIIPEAILKKPSLPERETAWRNNLKDETARRFNL